MVETDGNKKAEYKPASDCHQKLGWALNEFEDSVSNFRYGRAVKMCWHLLCPQSSFINHLVHGNGVNPASHFTSSA